MITTLYITRNGLLEPLGQSQVLPYLRRLARDYRVILMTREKDADWADAGAVAEAQAECNEYGIDWRPKPFRPRPRYFGPARDIAEMAGDVLRAVWRERVRLVHARSYIPAAVAWIVWRLTKTPFIFDMRALWPEELITAGRLRRGSLPHRAIAAMERACLRDSAAIVSLTHAAADYLGETFPSELAGKNVTVIPTCADLVRFSPPAVPKHGPHVYGCMGTVLSGWFETTWLAEWFSAAGLRDGRGRFEIVTRDNDVAVRAAVDPRGLLGERLSIFGKSPRDMPDVIRGHDVSVMFYAGGHVSELGRSPTRMAEVLGCGRPIVANPGVGDVARIIRKHRVGVIVDSIDPQEIAASLDELDDLFADPDLPTRCRTAAEAVFSLETGTEFYRALYRKIISEAE